MERERASLELRGDSRRLLEGGRTLGRVRAWGLIALPGRRACSLRFRGRVACTALLASPYCVLYDSQVGRRDVERKQETVVVEWGRG